VRQVLILIAIQVAALMFLFLADLLVTLLESLGKDATLTGRVPLWAIVDTYIRERPWFGYGYQAFWSVENPVSHQIADIIQWTPPHAHNGYRDVLLNFGAFGLALFMVAVAQAIRRAARLDFTFPGEGWCWMNVIIGVMLVMNLSESNFLAQNDIQWLLVMTTFAMVALRAPSVDWHRQKDDPSPHPEYPSLHL
jgi:exopolysaccharide production protein ExoQ